MKNNNMNAIRNTGNNPNQYHNQQQYQHDNTKRKVHHNHPQQSHGQSQSHNQPNYQPPRERSGQRNQATNQHPDSSVSRDNLNMNNNQLNLGSIKFTPGYPTRELPPIETKLDQHKKFSGRCRLFVGNLPHNTSEEKLKTLFDRFGEVGEVYLGPKSAFAFVKMDTRQNAEAARDALDCSTYEGRSLRVRLAAHAAAIRIKHLSPQVTNELLAYAFRYFGEIERAVVVVDDKGKSIGEGVVEYSRKQSALYAMKRCQQECFMLTASPKPVLVEPFDQHDEDEGLPEKSINRNSIEYKEQRDVGPRFAEQGTFEHTFALRWKDLYEVERQKRERLEQEIQEARKTLQDQIHYSRLEHDAQKLRNRLQELEGDKLKYQQLKEQTVTEVQQREEQRRQQDLVLRQREEEILRRQQLGDLNDLNQRESALRMQTNAIQDILSTHERSSSRGNETTDNISSEPADTTISLNQMGMMPQLANQPRTFADAAMMGMSNQGFIPMQQQMSMMPPTSTSQMSQPGLYPAFIPQPHQMQMTHDSTGMPYQMANFGMVPQQLIQHPQQQQRSSNGPPRQGNKFNRQHNETNNSPNNGRNRKRVKY